MSVQRLIDANFLAECIEGAANRLVSEYGSNSITDTLTELSNVLKDGRLGITVDAVPREEHESLLKRFRHLLESDYIRSFDEVVPLSGGKYKRDIREADRERPRGAWRGFWNGCPGRDQMHCTLCRCEIRYTDGFERGMPNYCPRCGANMKEDPDEVT